MPDPVTKSILGLIIESIDDFLNTYYGPLCFNPFTIFVIVPLGFWKLVELVIWAYYHVQISIN